MVNFTSSRKFRELKLEHTIRPTIASVETSLVNPSTATFRCTMEKCSFIASFFLFHLVLFCHIYTVQDRVLHSLNLSDGDRGGLANFISYLFVFVCVGYRIQ